MIKYYAVYDLKDNELCIGIFDKMQEVVDYLNVKNANVLASAISKKNAIKNRYIVVRILDQESLQQDL